MPGLFQKETSWQTLQYCWIGPHLDSRQTKRYFKRFSLKILYCANPGVCVHFNGHYTGKRSYEINTSSGTFLPPLQYSKMTLKSDLKALPFSSLKWATLKPNSKEKCLSLWVSFSVLLGGPSIYSAQLTLLQEGMCPWFPSHEENLWSQSFGVSYTWFKLDFNLTCPFSLAFRHERISRFKMIMMALS